MNNKKFLALLLVSIQLTTFTLSLFSTPSKVLASHSRVGLGTADSFAVLAGSDVNDTTPSTVIGDVGLSPATGAQIDIPCSEVTGTIYSVDAAGPLPCRVTNPALLTSAKNDLTTAYNDAAGRTASPDIGTNLGGTVLTDGTYHAASGTFSITGGQTLTLNGQGNADAVFIFKMDTTLITGSSSSVILTNGAQACNVFWQVGSSATLGTSTTLVGTVMADQSITDNGGSTVNGRLLASVAAVTLNNTSLTKSTCAAGTAGGSALTFASSGASFAACPALSSQVVSPIIVTSKRVDADSIFLSWGPYSGIDTFNVRYGPTNGNWLYNTDVTGFSTTINALPLNQPIWVQVAARNSCTIGNYGESKLVGGPSLPNAGVAPFEDKTSLYFFITTFVLLILVRKRHVFSSRH